MRRLVLSTLALLALAVTADAVAAAYRWTPAKAQIRVKAVYRTPDTTTGHATPPPDAVVDTAKCAGVGKPVNHRYARFHCTVVMKGFGEYAGDGFHAVQKLTVTTTGALTFAWSSGWH